MAKDWKFIQDLAAAVEKSMLPPGAIVTSPDRRVWDYDTESYTEVDVSIRYKFGSSDILVVMECRDRGRTDDKTCKQKKHAPRQRQSVMLPGANRSNAL
jgi:hypothetical protein